MSEFSDSDWIPPSTTALGALGLTFDESFFAPNVALPEPVSDPTSSAELTAALTLPSLTTGHVRPRSSSDLYNLPPETFPARSSNAGFLSAQGGDIARTRSLGEIYPLPEPATTRPRSSTALPNFVGTQESGLVDSNFGFGQNLPADLLTFTNSPHFSVQSEAAAYVPNYAYSDLNLGQQQQQQQAHAATGTIPTPKSSHFSTPIKRAREEDIIGSPEPFLKRRRPSSVAQTQPDLNEEEQLLLRLKDEQNLPWKDIALQFHLQLRKSHQVPALQMRYKRLREKLRVWSAADVQALEQAHEFWEKCKWDIISSKMLEYGCSEKWPSKYCVRKWDELHPNLDNQREQPSEQTSESPDQSSPE